MENLFIPGSIKETPLIDFNFETGVLTMEGDSLPENAMVFYEPIIQNLKNFLQNPPEKVVFEMKMRYFNTASSKKLLDIFCLLPEDRSVIRWYYSDEDMQEAGQGYPFCMDKTIPFEFIAVS